MNKKLINRLQKLNNNDKEQVYNKIVHCHECLIKNANKKDIQKISNKGLLKSIIEDNTEKDVQEIAHLAKKNPKKYGLTEEGEIIGFNKYEFLDIRWSQSLLECIDNYIYTKHHVADNPPIIKIPNTAKIALFGDYGVGIWDENQVVQTIQDLIQNEKPDLSIHLGDIYYAGSIQEAKENLLNFWPEAPQGNFTLNGNHEMYCEGKGYWHLLKNTPMFAKQQQNSYFALENDYWIIVCLDTASYASIGNLYMDGALHEKQLEFLQTLKSKNKPIMVMTHHNPIDMSGDTYQFLFHQVNDIIEDQLKYWYFGHKHQAAVYKDNLEEGNIIKFRLAGHGGLPYGTSSLLNNSSNILWKEKRKPQPKKSRSFWQKILNFFHIGGTDLRLQNGFCIIELNNQKILEKYIGEDGEIHWSSE